MSTELAMYTWHVNFNNYGGAGNSPIADTVKVDAAYFSADDHLVEFKDSDHQVVFAIHAGILTTIVREDSPVKWEPTA